MKIGICTGGGDCPGLNAVIRAATRHAILNHKIEVFGVERSITGLMTQPPSVRKIDLQDVAGVMNLGGTMLGTDNSGSPFKDPVKGEAAKEKAYRNWKTLGLDVLIVIGGDGTQRMALQLHEEGMPIIGVPKTIDNDYGATDLAIGFMTAVDVAAESIYRLHSTAESHSRIMVTEVMGRDAGYIALHAGIAAAANVILLPEIPFDYDKIIGAMEERKQRGRDFCVIVAAEGAREKGRDPIFRSSATGSLHLGGIADEVARQIHKRTGRESRVTVLGHIQRGGAPGSIDRIFATAFGVHAVNLAVEKKFGRVVGYKNGKITDMPYEDLEKGTRCLRLDDPFLLAAEAIGINLGR